MTEPYIGAMFKRQKSTPAKPPEFGECDLCDRAVESEPVMELSQVRFQHTLCSAHFRAAKDDHNAIDLAVEAKRAREAEEALGYYEQVEAERQRSEDERRLAEAQETIDRWAFEAERERIRKTKEFFDG